MTVVLTCLMINQVGCDDSVNAQYQLNPKVGYIQQPLLKIKCTVHLRRDLIEVTEKKHQVMGD